MRRNAHAQIGASSRRHGAHAGHKVERLVRDRDRAPTELANALPFPFGIRRRNPERMERSGKSQRVQDGGPNPIEPRAAVDVAGRREGRA